MKKGVSQNPQGSTCSRISFFNKVACLRPATLLKKEALTQVFCSKCYETFGNIFFYRKPLETAFVFVLHEINLTNFKV